MRRATSVIAVLFLGACASAGMSSVSRTRSEPGGGGAGARISMYVDGPRPIDGAGRWAAEVTLVNTGEAPVDVSEVSAHLGSYRGDERRACTPDGTPLEGIESLPPGDAVSFRATASCDVRVGDEVQASVRFGGDAPGLHRERHYVGVRAVD